MISMMARRSPLLGLLLCWFGCSGSVADSAPDLVCSAPLAAQDACCVPSTDPDPCYRCGEERCCLATKACRARGDCKEGLRSCLQSRCLPYLERGEGRAYSACEERCYLEHREGLVDWAPRVACLTVRCANEPACLDGQPKDPCLACVASQCQAEYLACEGSPDCRLLESCAAACAAGDEICSARCEEKYLAAARSFFALGACKDRSCSVSCPRGKGQARTWERAVSLARPGRS